MAHRSTAAVPQIGVKAAPATSYSVLGPRLGGADYWVEVKAALELPGGPHHGGDGVRRGGRCGEAAVQWLPPPQGV
jgi:hypothetical protein